MELAASLNELKGGPRVVAGRAHCGRLAIWVRYLAHQQGLTPLEQRTLDAAVPLHDRPLGLLHSASARDRLLQDLGYVALGADPEPPSAAEQLVAAWEDPRIAASASTRRCVDVLETAHLFEDRIEVAYSQAESIADVIGDLAGDPQTPPALRTLLSSWRLVAPEALLQLVPRSPLSPTVLTRLPQLLADDAVIFSELEEVIGTDPMLAGQLLQLANSARYRPLRGIGSIRQALMYLGLETSRQLLLAALMRPLLKSSPRLGRFWQHSLEVAHWSAHWAAQTGIADTGTAFLAGLLHDIGQLPVALYLDQAPAALAPLSTGGVIPSTLVETIICGRDHAWLGAEILRAWRFPEPLVEAIAQHHRLDGSASALAALLYCGEEWAAADEDLPSHWLRQQARQRLQLSAEQATAPLPDSGALTLLN